MISALVSAHAAMCRSHWWQSTKLEGGSHRDSTARRGIASLAPKDSCAYMCAGGETRLGEEAGTEGERRARTQDVASHGAWAWARRDGAAHARHSNSLTAVGKCATLRP